jgi:hypothetical protein
MSAHRRVLVHDCEPELDDGNRFYCACARRITSRDAADLVAAGQARWKLQRTTGRGPVEVHCEVILAERRHRLNARVVSDRDIWDAYVENVESARKRIERVGESQVAALVELGASGTKGGVGCKQNNSKLLHNPP